MAVGTYHFKHAHTFKERNFYMALAFFALPPFVLGGGQLLLPWNSLDVMTFSIALSILLNYAVLQKNRITRDPLTKLPNRVVMDQVLDEKMKNHSRINQQSSKKLYLLIGDLDRFKGINDEFGHVVGDEALVLAADILYKAASQNNGTAARFGGDEFVIILEAANEEKVMKFIDEVNKSMAIISKDKPYELMMSIGYTEYESGDSIQELLKKADHELYKVKEIRHAAR